MINQPYSKGLPGRFLGEIYTPKFLAPVSNISIVYRLATTPVIKIYAPSSVIAIDYSITTGTFKLTAPPSTLSVKYALSGTPTLRIVAPPSVIRLEYIFSTTVGLKVTVPSTITIRYGVSGGGFIKNTLMTGLLDQSETWVLNMETNAVTQYDRYGFNSFTFDGTRYLGFADDGVYELTGDTDDGLLIESTLQLAQTQFGTPNIKTVPYAWLGVNTLNAVFLKVNVDGQDYVYEAEAGRNALENQRVKLGRGLRSAFWTFTLTSLSAIELETITFQPIVLDRRI